MAKLNDKMITKQHQNIKLWNYTSPDIQTSANVLRPQWYSNV